MEDQATKDMQQYVIDDSVAFGHAVEFYAKAQGITAVEGYEKWGADEGFQALIEAKKPLFVARNLFQKIITECLGRATTEVEGLPGYFELPNESKAQKLTDKMNANPVYLLASEGLKNCVQAMEIK